MKLDATIDKLNAFKKIAHKVSSNNLGECELVSLNDDSFTIKVTFKNDDTEHRITGFSQD